MTVRLPGGVRWRVTWRQEMGLVMLHRTRPNGRRTLVATGRWQDGAIRIVGARIGGRQPSPRVLAALSAGARGAA